jgi:hypothetical protein
MIEVGAIFQRNNLYRRGDVPNYYMIITEVDNNYIYARRQTFYNESIHETVSWVKEDVLRFFERATCQ